MAEDALIAGAAAPARHRLIQAPVILDAVWVVVAAIGLLASAFFALIDLPGSTLRTGDAPLRMFVVGLPIVAIVGAIIAARRASTAVAAVATGILVPGAALAGSLSLLLFLDRGSAFADAGVAASLGGAALVLIAVVRWFVYHPVALLSNELRPPPVLSRVLAGLGIVYLLTVLALGFGSVAGGVGGVGQTLALLSVPLVVIAASIVRSVPAAAVAGGAAFGQVVAVAVAKVEQSSIEFDSDLLLRTGAPGLVLLVAMVGVGVVCVLCPVADVDSAEVIIDDDKSWRWSADD